MTSIASKRPQLGAGWSLWRPVLLRGAGFSFSWLEQTLAAPGTEAWRGVAAHPRFREAVTWQNRAAVVDGLDSLLRKPPGATDSKTRKKELMVARYLQRYCAKNDTIGFFGPVGWAEWGEGRFEPAKRLIEARKTFLEPWAARAIADAIAPDQARVVLPGDVRIDGRTLRTPTSTVEVTAEEARFLRVLQRSGPMVASKVADQALLERLTNQNIVRLTFAVAISHDPLRFLPQRAPPVVRVKKALSKVDSAAGTAKLGAALVGLEKVFTEATGAAAKRHEGRTYGGRGLVYEECRRSLELSLSPAMLEQVAQPLVTVLGIARWYTYRIARLLSVELLRTFKQLGDAPLPLHVFWAETAGLFDGETPSSVAAVASALREKLTRERGAFSAPCPGWPGARHHSPDLMWAAPSAEAMLRGEGLPVLSELHPGVNTFTTLSELAHAPDRRLLEREWLRDLGSGGISPIPWEDFARSSQDARLAKDHWHLDLGFDFDSERPANRVLRAADCTVRRVGKGLVVTRGRQRFDLWEVFERRIRLKAASAFSLGTGLPTGPRRLLGGVVIERAHWRFEAADLRWLDDELNRVERAAAFREAHRLPRRVFLRSPTEVKPLYLDWHSPILLDLLARLSRQAPWLSFSEMLPGPDELWLRDAKGARYVCELRSIAVDPVPWSSKAVWS